MSESGQGMHIYGTLGLGYTASTVLLQHMQKLRLGLMPGCTRLQYPLQVWGLEGESYLTEPQCPPECKRTNLVIDSVWDLPVCLCGVAAGTGLCESWVA